MGLGRPPLWGGGVVLVPLPGCAIKVWLEGAVTGIANFFRCVLLSFATFVLGVKRSFLSICLAAAMFEFSESEPRLTVAEKNSEV